MRAVVIAAVSGERVMVAVVAVVLRLVVRRLVEGGFGEAAMFFSGQIWKDGCFIFRKVSIT